MNDHSALPFDVRPHSSALESPEMTRDATTQAAKPPVGEAHAWKQARE